MRILPASLTPPASTPVVAAAPIDAPSVRDASPQPPTEGPLLARFDAKPDLSEFAELPRGGERRQAVYDALVETADASQAEAVAKLDGLKSAGVISSYESLFMPNALVIRPEAGQAEAVRSALAGVAHLTEVTTNTRFEDADGPKHAAAPKPDAAIRDSVQGAEHAARGRALLDGPTWGVSQINADDLWRRGITGENVTVGVVDSGLDATHPAIAPHYRGTQADGSQVHDYNWLDPFDGAAVPKDVHYHGTHVAGTIAGGVTGGAGIGVAPGAKLIAARANDADGSNLSIETLKALQFMLAPTKTDGTNPDPKRGADIVNNSWGNPDSHEDPTFRDSFDALRAAGIIVVTAAGNEGRDGDNTVHAPGIYPGFTTVAATDSNDRVTVFSSRGKPGSERDPATMTPNIAAPGAGIISAVTGGGYKALNGTSMASPHVAGAIALALSAKPDATEDEIRKAIFDTALDVEEAGPDIKTGHGRLDIAAAVDRLIGTSPAADDER